MMWKILSLMVILPIALQAQDRSIEEFMQLSKIIAPDADADYELVRCGGFYRSLHLVFDDSTLGADGDAKMEQLEKAFVATAALIRQDEQQISDVDALANVTADVEALAGLYIERYRVAAQAGRAPFVGDQMLVGDNAYCTDLFVEIVASYD